MFQIVKAAGKGKLATLLKTSLEDVGGDVLDLACNFPIIKTGCKAVEAVGDLVNGKEKEGKRLRRRAQKI